MLHVASSVGFLEMTALIALVAAISGGIVAVRKLGPEKDALYITSAQGAAVIMDNLISTLREEVDRERARVTFLESELLRVTGENERLVAENQGLRKKYGERHDDRDI